MSDLDQILSGENAPANEEAEQPEAVEAEAPEQPPEGAEAEQAEAPSDAKEEPTVPLSAFKAMRDDLRQQVDEIRNNVARQQPRPEPPKAPDVFENPEAYTRHMQQETQRAILSAKADISQAMAEKEFGAETVEAALKAAQASPEIVRQFLNDAHPYGRLMEWHQSRQAMAEIGPDPAAYRQRIEAEIRQKIEAEMAAKQVNEMRGKSAPSLADVNGSGGVRDPGWTGPKSLSAIIGE